MRTPRRDGRHEEERQWLAASRYEAREQERRDTALPDGGHRTDVEGLAGVLPERIEGIRACRLVDLFFLLGRFFFR